MDNIFLIMANDVITLIILLLIIIGVWTIIGYFQKHEQRKYERKVEEEKAQRINKNEKDILIDILRSLKRIEVNTTAIKWGIAVIMFLAFVLPIILSNLLG